MPTGPVSSLLPALRRVVLAGREAARSDGELLGAFVADRDSDAFTELVRRHGPMVLGVCRRVAGDRTTADDAFQAAFIVLARRAASVRPREQVGNFLYGVAYRTALKARMVLARRRSREKQVETMPEPTAPAARTDWTDLLPVIDEELAKLPDKLRLPVILCDLEGRPQREVAKHLDVPPATLATRLASARRTLAARLTRRGVTLSGGALAGLLGAHAAAFAVSPALAGGLVRAAEAVATGASIHSLVSANAVQLSEGVLRMMMLAKLKAVAVLAVTALVLTTGLGVGLVPAAADDGPARADTRATDKARPTVPATKTTDAPADPNADDATFLRRLSLDVRGTLPTDVEMWFFVSDEDDEKRAKVVDWMTDDETVKAAIAKKLGVDADRVKLIRGRLSADGQFVEVTVEETKEVVVKPVKVAFAPDDKFTTEVKVIRAHDAAVADRLRTAKTVAVKALAERATAEKDVIVTLQKVLGADDKTAKPASENHSQFQIVAAADDATNAVWLTDMFTFVAGNAPADSDAEFLKRVLTDVRGSGPTALELKYFTEDKDPKKREKLIDTLLKEPATQKKLGDSWKAKMLALQPAKNFKEVKGERIFITLNPDSKPKDAPKPIVVKPLTPTKEVVVDVVVPNTPKPPVPPKPPAPPQPPVIVKPLVVPGQPVAPQNVRPVVVEGQPLAPQAGKLDKLVAELIAAKKSDEAILEALTLATLSRLPTESEKRLTLAGVSTAADRKVAWVAVARALAGTDGGTPVKVKIVVDPAPSVPPTPPVPPAKP